MHDRVSRKAVKEVHTGRKDEIKEEVGAPIVWPDLEGPVEAQGSAVVSVDDRGGKAS